MKETTCGVQPSDEGDSGDHKEVVILQESGKCEKSVLVFDAHHSQQQCAPQKEDILKDASSSMVHDHPKVSETVHVSVNSKDTSPRAHPDSDSLTPFSSVFVYLVFVASCFKFFKSVILFLTLFCICISAEQSCDKVLTAHDVESIASRDLNFHHGGFKEIEQGAFANAEAAERLVLSHNCLQTVPENAFENMTSVYRIYMGQNRFTGYPLAFQGPDNVKNLMNLKFESNFISYFGKDFLKGKEKLSNLNFADNWIESIHNKALDPAVTLKRVNFSRNKLTSLPQVNLTQLKNLKLLDFSLNPLKSLKIGYYSNLPEVNSITITVDSMSLKIGTERDVVFLIAGNSETISCEENKQDILRSNVVINYTIYCKDRNGNFHVLTELNILQDSTTAVMPDVNFESTPLLTNSEHVSHVNVVLSVLLALTVVLLIVAVVIIIVSHCRRINVPQPSKSTSDVEEGEDGIQNIPLVEEKN